MQYEDGAIRVPEGPGLGVRLNREKLREYSELYRRLGGYPYDQDPAARAGLPSFPTTAGPIRIDDPAPGHSLLICETAWT